MSVPFILVLRVCGQKLRRGEDEYLSGTGESRIPLKLISLSTLS
jgi:hypothetical protein